MATVTVDSDTWKAFNVPFTAQAGTHSLSVAFVNDYYGGSGKDRNLWVDSVTAAAAVEAEAAHTKTSGSPVSGGWVFAQSGLLQNSFALGSAGQYVVSVVARGTPALGISPIMELRLDGTTIATTTVSSTSWTSMAMNASLLGGTHDLAIGLVNGGNGRKLYVDRFSVALAPASN